VNEPWGCPTEPFRRLLSTCCGVDDLRRWHDGWAEALPAQGAAIQPSLLWGLVLPLLNRCLHGVEARPAGKGGTLLIGLNGPVGAGKTTIGALLESLAPRIGLRLAVASIDDLYRPWEERRERLRGNPFGVSRVPPGSHDVDLLADRLDRWRASGELVLPVFDKRLRSGEGDRAGWSRRLAEVVVLEGWLVGCQPLDAPALMAALEPPGCGPLTPEERAWLPRWNRELGSYAGLWDRLDGLWLLRPESWTLPRRWRFQAEARQRRSSQAVVVGDSARSGGLNLQNKWLLPKELDRLVLSSLHALPPELYQDPLRTGQRSEAVVELDGRRRCRWSGLAAEAAERRDQLSSSAEDSSIG
jgi:D-glycerate 3-kinase